MASTTYYAYVSGTSALKGDCSQAAIIDFPEPQAEPELYRINYRAISHASHATLMDRAKALACAILQKSGSLHDILTGDTAGVPFGEFTRLQKVGFPLAYTLLAMGAIFFAI